MQNLSNINIGDTIEFGSYPFWSNGDKEPIKWQVLDKKDDRIFVISKYGLDAKPYHAERETVTWETCTLRKWLNHDFIDAAFTEDEKKQIVLSHVSADPSPKWNIDYGNDTEDYVFLLSAQDAGKKYIDTNTAREISPTPFAASKKVCTYKGLCYWWLRTPGYNFNHAAVVYNSLYPGCSCSVDFNDVAVRPAMWIKIGNQ